jgi:hypothetical protein
MSQSGGGKRPRFASLEIRSLGSSPIIRISLVRKLANEAAENGTLVPDLATEISRVNELASVR